jgi:hypothetical protein
MLNTRRLAGVAAYLNAFVALGTLGVALLLIGPAALADRQTMAALALHNPMPLFIQDGLKIVSALIATVLIAGLYDRLQSAAPALALAASLFGAVSILCLVANAGLSLYATSQAALLSAGRAQMLTFAISLLGLGALVANGPWYLLVSSAAWRSGRLPRALAGLGLVLGLLSFIPPLAFLLLLLTIAWSLALGRALQHDRRLLA